MPSEYLPVLIFLMVATAFGIGSLLIGELLRPRRPYSEKLMPYESGNATVGQPYMRFSIKFYIIAMLFVVFDVEAVFMFPWATQLERYAVFGLVEMGVFVFVLLLGLVYAWRKGVLRWV